eukprot:256092_1
MFFNNNVVNNSSKNKEHQLLYCLLILVLWIMLWFMSHIIYIFHIKLTPLMTAPVHINTTIHDYINVNNSISARANSLFISSGWDEGAKKIYYDTTSSIKQHLFQNKDTTSYIQIAPFATGLTVYTGNHRYVWPRINNNFPPQWEHETYEIYFQYINSNTILIDFGTWVGVTILYGAQFAYKSYGIEADPAAFAELEINLKLNQNKIWYKTVHIHAGGVSNKNDSGAITMQSWKPGNSCSRLTDKLGRCKEHTNVLHKWKVDCHPLDYYMHKWDIWNDVYEKDKNIFVKIDIESY